MEKIPHGIDKLINIYYTIVVSYGRIDNNYTNCFLEICDNYLCKIT